MDMTPYFDQYCRVWKIGKKDEDYDCIREHYVCSAKNFLGNLALTSTQFEEKQAIILKHLMQVWKWRPITESIGAMDFCSNLLYYASRFRVHPRYWSICGTRYPYPFLTNAGVDRLLGMYPSVRVCSRGTTTRKAVFKGMHLPSWVQVVNDEDNRSIRYSVDLVRNNYIYPPTQEDFVNAAKLHYISVQIIGCSFYSRFDYEETPDVNELADLR
jgi:hypothetical protein